MKKILLILLLLVHVNASDKIRIMTEIFAPFQYEHNGEVIGIATEIVQAIQKEIHSTDEIKVYPWKRAVKITDKKKNSAIFSMLRTPERENKYQWVGPLTSMQMVFFKKKGSKITLKSLEDAKKVAKIGVTKGVANFEVLNTQGFDNFDFITNGKDETNINKLVKGRIDLWPTLLMAGLYNAKVAGFAGEIVPIENVVIFSGDMYIAFNLQTDETIVQKWQEALDTLKKDQTVKKIIKRYK